MKIPKGFIEISKFDLRSNINIYFFWSQEFIGPAKYILNKSAKKMGLCHSEFLVFNGKNYPVEQIVAFFVEDKNIEFDKLEVPVQLVKQKSLISGKYYILDMKNGTKQIAGCYYSNRHKTFMFEDEDCREIFSSYNQIKEIYRIKKIF